MDTPEIPLRRSHRAWRLAALTSAGCMIALLGLAAPGLQREPAKAAPSAHKLPAPPANGTMGFLVEQFGMARVGDKDACPDGGAVPIRESYLDSLPEAERARLSLKENESELTRRWQATVFKPDGSNMCSQPDSFDVQPFPVVQGRHSWGFDLDNGSNEGGCDHEEFETPAGEKGIDNQEYRVMGCFGRPGALAAAVASAAAGGNAARANEGAQGMKQFMASGEWTQVILLRGVNSLENDPEVEVIYGNTADPPPADTQGNFLPGASFTISDTGSRHRNVLRGRIVDGVLTTDTADVVLAQTWGQGGVREIRGARWKYRFHKARLRLEFQADGTIRGMLGGYRPTIDLLSAETLGGPGAATTAGIDCARRMATANKFADGMRDPKTGKCTAVSSAFRIGAIPAFVNDVATARTATR